MSYGNPIVSHCVVQADLELMSSCLSLSDAGTTGMQHHNWLGMSDLNSWALSLYFEIGRTFTPWEMSSLMSRTVFPLEPQFPFLEQQEKLYPLSTLKHKSNSSLRAGPWHKRLPPLCHQWGMCQGSWKTGCLT